MVPEERELIIESLEYAANDRRKRAATASNSDSRHILIALAEQAEALAKRLRNFKL